MTRRLSLITAVGVAALSVGAPAAFGKVHANAEVAPVVAQPDPMIEDGFAQAVAQVPTTGFRDAHERGSTTNLVQSNVPEYRDSFERMALHDRYRIGETPGGKEIPRGILESERMATAGASVTTGNISDSFDRAELPRGSAPVSASASGSEVEWPQIGVGLGIGLLLALGIGLIMRAGHVRPFAH